MKIYINGKYDYRANLKLKINDYIPILVNRVDDFFTKH